MKKRSLNINMWGFSDEHVCEVVIIRKKKGRETELRGDNADNG